MADFRVGLIAAKHGIDVDEDNFRNCEAKCAADFSGDEFCDESQRSLPCSAKFNDVEAEIVRLHNGGQRSSFSKRQLRSGLRSQFAALSSKFSGFAVA